jgi:hypothetical protein
VKYKTSDSDIKKVELEFEGQGKRNEKFTNGLILKSGNLTQKNNTSLYIGFWYSYLTKIKLK